MVVSRSSSVINKYYSISDQLGLLLQHYAPLFFTLDAPHQPM
jgi:hypothetical protein